MFSCTLSEIAAKHSCTFLKRSLRIVPVLNMKTIRMGMGIRDIKVRVGFTLCAIKYMEIRLNAMPSIDLAIAGPNVIRTAEISFIAYASRSPVFLLL